MERIAGQLRPAGKPDTPQHTTHLPGDILTKAECSQKVVTPRVICITLTCWMSFEAIRKQANSGASPLQVLESHASSLFRREQVLQDRGHQLHDAHLGMALLFTGGSL